MAGPEKTYGLSSADVRKLRDISKRVLGGNAGKRPPPTRRRRGPGGGSTLAMGRLVNTVAAQTTADDCFEVEQWDEDSGWFVASDAYEEMIGFVNFTNSEILGSADNDGASIRFLGLIQRAKFGEEFKPVFLPATGFDHASMHGHTNDPDVTQIPRRIPGTHGYEVVTTCEQEIEEPPP